MDARRFDEVAKRMATTAPRRRILQGLGALGVGSLGVLGLAEAGSAQDLEAAVTRKCRRRCRRKCKDRKPKCTDNCIQRKC